MKSGQVSREQIKNVPIDGPSQRGRRPVTVSSRRPLTLNDVRSTSLRLDHAFGSSTATASALQGVARSPDQQLDTARRGIGGSGGPLPHLAEIQRSFGHHDVSHVSAHQGSRAISAARVIGARGYTIGDRVAFAGKPDLHTAAHEAAHVVQQRAGVHLAGDVGEAGDTYERHADAVADQVVRGHSAEALLDQKASAGSRSLGVQRQVVQRAPISTDFGVFDTTKYDSTGPAGAEWGLDIAITFDPDRVKADARKIGLVQSIRYQLGGSAVAGFPSHHRRMVPSGTGEGSQIDRYGGGPYGNPLYAADSPGAKDKLGDTPTVPGWGQHGWNYKDKTGALQHEVATLFDQPSLPGRKKNAAQTFETAALAVEGKQSGTYMGSVSWGWSTDAAGKFTKLPFSLKSKGKPSAAFIAAAKQWNTVTNFGTWKTTADPTNVYDASFSVAFSVAKNTTVELSTTESGIWSHGDVTYNSVTITSGKKSGREGRIKVSDMRDVGGSNRVLKLPIP